MARPVQRGSRAARAKNDCLNSLTASRKQLLQQQQQQQQRRRSRTVEERENSEGSETVARETCASSSSCFLRPSSPALFPLPLPLPLSFSLPPFAGVSLRFAARFCLSSPSHAASLPGSSSRETRFPAFTFPSLTFSLSSSHCLSPLWARDLGITLALAYSHPLHNGTQGLSWSRRAAAAKRSGVNDRSQHSPESAPHNGRRISFWSLISASISLVSDRPKDSLPVSPCVHCHARNTHSRKAHVWIP